MKWFSPEQKPEHGQEIIVLWRKSEKYQVEVSIATYKAYYVNNNKMKYPFRIAYTILGWIPMPDYDKD